MTRDQQLPFVQPSVVAKLLGEAYFNYITVFPIYEKRLDSQVDLALSGLAGRNGKGGATIEVYYPTSNEAILGSPGPDSYLEQVFIVRTQNTVNKGAHGTGLDCEAIAERIVSTFHQWYLGGLGGSFFPAATFREAIDTGKVGMQAQKVTMRIGIKSDPLPKTGTPPLPIEGPLGTWSLSPPSSDPDAVIYYTTDGSPPGPGNYADTFPPSSPPVSGQTGTSNIFAEPFPVPSGTVIRYSAWAPGKLGSSEVLVTTLDPTLTAPTYYWDYETTDQLFIQNIPAGATVRFTTDGSTPTLAHGFTFTIGSIPFPENTVVKYIAFLTGWLPSNMVTTTPAPQH